MKSGILSRLMCTAAILFSISSCYDIDDVRANPERYENARENKLEAKIKRHVIFMKKDDNSFTRIHDTEKDKPIGKDYPIKPSKTSSSEGSIDFEKDSAMLTFQQYRGVKFFEIIYTDKDGEDKKLLYANKSEETREFSQGDEVIITRYGTKYLSSVEPRTRKGFFDPGPVHIEVPRIEIPSLPRFRR